MVKSGELVVSPTNLVGVGLFAAPYVDSLICVASSVPRVSSLRAEWCASKSPMILFGSKRSRSIGDLDSSKTSELKMTNLYSKWQEIVFTTVITTIHPSLCETTKHGTLSELDFS